MLGQALEIVREPAQRIAVTVDARPLEGAVTGTHVNILELTQALARTRALELRVLVRAARLDRNTTDLLSRLPHCELLAAEQVGPATERTTVFHRPLQTFSPEDVSLALQLGDRFVLSQLDLIAYRNPAYFEDGAGWEDYRAASRHGLAAAERVIVFSQHTRRELLADALVEEARIRVIPPGLDHGAIAAPARPSGLAEDPPPEPYLLCLGTDFRHKNRLFALRLLRGAARASRLSGRAPVRRDARPARLLAGAGGRLPRRAPAAAGERALAGRRRGERQALASGARPGHRVPLGLRGLWAGALRGRPGGGAVRVRRRRPHSRRSRRARPRSCPGSHG